MHRLGEELCGYWFDFCYVELHANECMFACFCGKIVVFGGCYEWIAEGSEGVFPGSAFGVPFESKMLRVFPGLVLGVPRKSADIRSA